MSTTKTATRPAARKAGTRTDRFMASLKPGAAWLIVWHLVVVWRDSTWPVASTAVSAITAMATSVL